MENARFLMMLETAGFDWQTLDALIANETRKGNELSCKVNRAYAVNSLAGEIITNASLLRSSGLDSCGTVISIAMRELLRLAKLEGLFTCCETCALEAILMKYAPNLVFIPDNTDKKEISDGKG